MGGEGSMSAANQSLKMNRKALRSKRKGYKENYDSATLSKQKIKSKDISAEELAAIKVQFQAKSKLRKKKHLIAFLIIFICIITLILLTLS